MSGWLIKIWNKSRLSSRMQEYSQWNVRIYAKLALKENNTGNPFLIVTERLLMHVIWYIFFYGTTMENKGKLILTEIFPSVQKHDI
jgi:Chromosome segregation ATPases